MPVRDDKLTRKELPEESKLRAELIAELKNPKDSGEPEIIIERPNPFTTHLYAIWAEWNDLSQSVRSRIILDSFEDAYGKEEAVKVTVAMGLTRAEADRLGLQ